MNMDYSRNGDLKRHAKDKGIKLWELADALGVSEFTLSKRLRRDLPGEELARYMSAIDQLAAAREAVRS